VRGAGGYPLVLERQQRRLEQVLIRIVQSHPPFELGPAPTDDAQSIAVHRRRPDGGVARAGARTTGQDEVSDFRNRRPSPRLLSGNPKGSEPERFDLRWRQRNPGDGVDPALRESLPRPFDLRNRDTGLPQEVSERVEPLALGLATQTRAVQWREGDPVHGVDRIDVPTDPQGTP
jgi:hypothetical protein